MTTRDPLIADYVSPLTAVNRLLRLEDLIRHAKNRFEIGSFRCQIDTYSKSNLKPAQSLGCDTAGCIAGWGTCVAPELRFDKDSRIRNTKLPRRHPPDSHFAFGAAFGLTHIEAFDLCLRNLHQKETPKAAADAVAELAQELADYHDLVIE